MTTPQLTLGEAAHNSLRLVRQMIEAGADPNYSEDGLVPLREACTHGHIPIIKYLLAHGADPNGRDPDCGESILQHLINRYWQSPVGSPKFRRKNYIPPKRVNTAVLRRLLRAGADPNLNNPDEDFQRPMFHWALVHNVKRVVSILLDFGADPNGRGQVHGGETPLMTACYFSDINIVEKLLEYPVDVNAKDGEGHNALFYVIAGDCPPREVLPRFKLLYRHGIDLSARDNRGENILQSGIRNDKETRNWLLAHGVKP